MNAPELSIVIPTLNEAVSLPGTLESLVGGSREVERIVVDGGSSDSTVAIARRFGCVVIESPTAQRAHQLNLGAKNARAETLLFLHADTRLPNSAPDEILETLCLGGAIGGSFVRIFDSDSGFLKLTCRVAAWRSHTLGIFLGDQGIFVKREAFESLGGFDEAMALAEDLDFSRRLRRLGKVVTLKGPAISSARRFEKRGPVRQTLFDLWLALRFAAGTLTPPS